MIALLFGGAAHAQILQQDQKGLHRCKVTKAHGLADALVQSPFVSCAAPNTAWCDASNALGLCCEPGTTYDGNSCVCDERHHLEGGHCCASGERWVNPTAISRNARGRCCPEGTEGISGSTYSTDIGVVGGSIVACCAKGEQVDTQGCYEPMPCRPLEPHGVHDARASFLACGESQVHRASSGSAQAKITLGPMTGGDPSTRAKLTAALKAIGPQLRACYQEALADEPKLAGILDAELAVFPDGKLRVRRISPAVGAVPDAITVCAATTITRANLTVAVPPEVSFHVLMAFQHPSRR